ncbi:cupredoxin domain-containing protein, partial [Kitasatospora phosalacinea]|uniref:cupredoxin domain-containing protein n=1 Tax=Kitasatospora phosalacinea TaxID=2065 RepID=UPI00364FBF56
MPARPRTSAAAFLVLAVAGAALAGCSKKDDGAPVSADGVSGPVQVTATDDRCELSRTSFPAGHVELAVSNKGGKVTEVYVYGDGDKIVTERENIGPGTKVTVNAEIKAGTYEVACKPGMTGDGIRQKITVTAGSSAPAKADDRLTQAVADYRKYAQEQADATIP